MKDTVAKLDGSKIFYEHLTLPLTLMVSELHRRIERYEEVIAKKDKNIKILYDQLVLLEETPPKSIYNLYIFIIKINIYNIILYI